MKTKIRSTLTKLCSAALLAGAFLGTAAALAPAPALAQNLFETVIRVNDQAITRFEIEQRARMLTLFRAPGDPIKLAREQLVEERLKMDAAITAGFVLEEAQKTQRIATSAFEKTRREVVVSRRWVYWVYALILVLVAWASATAAFIFSDFIDGDWAHQLNTASDPSALCQQQGFVVDRRQNGEIICASDVRVIRDLR